VITDIQTDVVPFAPGQNAYNREPHLTRTGPGTSVAVWIDSDGYTDRIAWRQFVDGRLTSIRYHDAVPAAFLTPWVSSRWVVWGTADNARGSVQVAEFADARDVLRPVPVPAWLATEDLGAFGAAEDDDGRLWLLTEVWHRTTVSLRLVCLDDGTWNDEGTIGLDSGICLRPKLCCSAGGLRALWNVFVDGRYHVETVDLLQDHQAVSRLPQPEDTWETLANLACTVSTDVADSGKDLIFCVGQDPGDVTKHFAVTAVSQ